MNWLTDAPAHYRLRAALEAGKCAVRKLDSGWYLFLHLGADGLPHPSHASALAAAVKMRVCKPYDKASNSGSFCFDSLLSQVGGIKFDEHCIECFAAAGYTVDNSRRKPRSTDES